MKRLLFLLTLILLVCSGTSSASTPHIDTNATKLLQQMANHLGGIDNFTVKTQTTLEDLLPSGHRIDIDVANNVMVSRPNMIRSERKGNGIDQIFFYNGEEITLYHPLQNLYASVDAPNSFHQLFAFLYESLGLAFPVSDLLYKDAYPLLMEDVYLAQVIGNTYIGDTECTHLVFSRKGVDFQIWISNDGPLLPVKYIVTDRSGPERLSVTTLLYDWNFKPDFTDDDFTFHNTNQAESIEFIYF